MRKNFRVKGVSIKDVAPASGSASRGGVSPPSPEKHRDGALIRNRNGLRYTKHVNALVHFDGKIQIKHLPPQFGAQSADGVRHHCWPRLLGTSDRNYRHVQTHSGRWFAGAGFWLLGTVDFYQAGRWTESLRLIQELALSFLAAAALCAAGRPILGLTLVLLSIVHHILVSAVGEKRLKR